MSVTLSALKYNNLKMPQGWRRVRYGEKIPSRYKYISRDGIIREDTYFGQTRRGSAHETIYLKTK